MKIPAVSALDAQEAAGRRFSSPAVFWLALPLVALWPAWQWSAVRLADGSDDPLGIIALCALVLVLCRDRCDFDAMPRASWLLASIYCAAVAAFGTPLLPGLLRGVFAVASLMAMITALHRPQQPILPHWGLGFLALPLLSSLQFFVGYPLRVITAQASAWLLELAGIAALREGSSMTVNGQLVIVDAPCSGIQMAWFAYFTACIAACWLRLPDRIFLRRLPAIGLTVLAGNIVRNTILVARETGLLAWPEWTHEGTGAAIFAAVCILVLRRVAAAYAKPQQSNRSSLRNDPPRRTLQAAVLCFTLFAFAPLFFSQTASPTASLTVAVEWPRQAFGRDLRPLALSDVEQNFAGQFPGAITRLTDDENLYTLRQITHPTRKLHPSADCFRGLGYRIGHSWLEQRNLLGKPETLLSRCFIAEKSGENGIQPIRLRVCEQIVDTHGNSYTDTSSWYWSALFGQTRGPWHAITVASPL